VAHGSQFTAVVKTTSIIVAFCLCANPVTAQTRADSTAPVPPFFLKRDLWIAAGFVAGTIALAPLDKRFARSLQNEEFQESGFMQSGAKFFRVMGQPVPQILGVGMYGVGRIVHSERVQKLALHGVESMLLASLVTEVVKDLAGRARPCAPCDVQPFGSIDSAAYNFSFGRGFKGRDYQSFPSGHASTAFAVASAVTSETLQWLREDHGSTALKLAIGTAMYGGAALVGVSRMYHDQHWASDVMAGAAIGTFSGLKVVTYAYRHPRNFVDRTLIATTVVPAPGGGTFVALSLKF
jgi:membrane-associated phospholipid phosphatase